jgi:uncharacterized OsmC-like protein
MLNQALPVQQPTVRNGVDVTALFATIDAVKGNPDIAQFQFRAQNRWMGGDHNRSTVEAFHGACQELRHDAAFTMDNDEPAVPLGADRYANPVEYVLHALVGCLTTTMAYHAAARGIAIEAIDSRIEGDLDLRGFLGLSNEVRKGFHTVRVHMRVKSTAAAPVLRDLAQFARLRHRVELAAGGSPRRDLLGAGAQGAGHARERAAPCALRQVATSLRCACTLISTPSPMNSDTIAVPPYDTSGSGTPTTGRMPLTMPMFTNA